MGHRIFYNVPPEEKKPDMLYKGNTPIGHKPLPKRRPICVFFLKKQLRVRSHCNDVDYSVTRYFCTKRKIFIKRKDCKDCKCYQGVLKSVD